MLKAVMTAPGEIEFRDVEVPVPGENEVLIKIRRIGICGSDIHVYHGKHPFTGYPVTQGYEVSGDVVGVGAGATRVRAGQKVTIEPQVFCGKCHPCRHGKYNLCEELKVMGFQTEGMAAEYFCVDESKVTVLPEELSYDEGAIIEPLAVAVHAVRRFGDMEGKNVAILGAGPIGILVAQAAKGMGAARVMVTDILPTRLEKARECGVDDVYDTTETGFGDALVRSFGPDKADVIYDCAGNDTTMGQAIQHARKGSAIILTAVFARLAKVDLAVLNDHELDLNTTMMYRHEDFVKAIELVRQKKVDLRPLMSGHFPFRQYSEAYRHIDGNRETSMKILIDMDG